MSSFVEIGRENGTQGWLPALIAATVMGPKSTILAAPASSTTLAAPRLGYDDPNSRFAPLLLGGGR
jgi:hypothetical protein